MSFLPRVKKSQKQEVVDEEFLEGFDDFKDDGSQVRSEFESENENLDDGGLDNDNFLDGLGLEDTGATPMSQHKDLLLNLTDFKRQIIEPKMHSWNGDVLDPSTGKWMPRVNQPIMNPKGISWAVSFIQSYAHGGNILTHFDHDSFSQTMIDVIEVAWKKLANSMNDFEIADDEDLLRICVDIEHTVKHILQGAGSGKYKDFLGTVTHRSENVTSNSTNNGMMGAYPYPVKKKTGFLRGLFKQN